MRRLLAPLPIAVILAVVALMALLAPLLALRYSPKVVLPLTLLAP